MAEEYFAELDADNRIACVWMRGRAERPVRPLGLKGQVRRPAPGARFHGAPRAAILDWIDRKAGSTGTSNHR